MEVPKQKTPEEIAALEKSRTISDAELLKDGAEYVMDENGEKRLQVGEFRTHRLEKQDPADPLKKKVSSMIEVACEQAGNRGDLQVWYKNHSSGGGSRMMISYKTDGIRVVENIQGTYLEVVGKKFDRFGNVSAGEAQQIPVEDILKILPKVD